jgi:hypothetical protein
MVVTVVTGTTERSGTQTANCCGAGAAVHSSRSNEIRATFWDAIEAHISNFTGTAQSAGGGQEECTRPAYSRELRRTDAGLCRREPQLLGRDSGGLNGAGRKRLLCCRGLREALDARRIFRTQRRLRVETRL